MRLSKWLGTLVVASEQQDAQAPLGAPGLTNIDGNSCEVVGGDRPEPSCTAA